ncbi:hypothetical protein AMAG_20098, partial [Allomyces macrogynus ATCC 38327]
MRDAAQFYLNRVAREWRDKDATHVEWGKAFTTTLNALNKYVMEWHTTGLAWNAKGVDLKTALDQVKAGGAPAAAPGAPRARAPPAGGPPPPPPPPPSAPHGAARGPSAARRVPPRAPIWGRCLLRQLNVGSAITGRA